LNKLKYLFLFFILLFLIGVGEFFYLKTLKPSFAIPLQTDTSISTEAHFIRHRSQTDLFEVFGIGPGFLPYFPSDFVYAPPVYLNAKGEIR
jgi:hypothetical protein